MFNKEMPSENQEQSQKPRGLKRGVFLSATAASSALILEKFARGMMAASTTGAPSAADTQAVVGDANYPQQFEFYDYTGGNLAETGNSYLSEAALASSYQSAFNDIAQSELYIQYPQVQAAYNQALQDYFNGVSAGVNVITDMES